MGLFGFGKKNKRNAGETEQESFAAVEREADTFEPGDLMFEIDGVHPWNEQGSVLIGRMTGGELLPGTRVSYHGADGKRVFDCTVETVEQGGRALKKGSACCFGVYGPVFSLVVPDFAPNAFCVGNTIRRRAGEEALSPVLEAFEACRMTKERTQAVQETLRGEELTEEACASFSIQELICALSFVRTEEKNAEEDAEAEEWKRRSGLLYSCMLEKIKSADAVYMTFDKATGFPFYNNGMVDLYSRKEYAELAVLYDQEMFRELEVRELTVLPAEVRFPDGPSAEEQPDKRIPAFAMLYYLGMERVMIDNGFYRALIGRAEVLPPPDYTGKPEAQIPVINPALRTRMLDFFGEVRWKVSYDKRTEVLQTKEQAMLAEVAKSRLLVPMRCEGTMQKKPGENQLVLGKGAKLLFAAIKNTAGESYTPVFTDITEFAKLYPMKEWGATVMTIRDVINVNKGVGIAVNPAGENLVLKERAITAIRELLDGPKEQERAQEDMEQEGTEQEDTKQKA